LGPEPEFPLKVYEDPGSIYKIEPAFSTPHSSLPDLTGASHMEFLSSLRNSYLIFLSRNAYALWLWMDSQFSASTLNHLIFFILPRFTATSLTTSSTNMGLS